jgi:hypothetical protein
LTWLAARAIWRFRLRRRNAPVHRLDIAAESGAAQARQRADSPKALGRDAFEEGERRTAARHPVGSFPIWVDDVVFGACFAPTSPAGCARGFSALCRKGGRTIAMANWDLRVVLCRHDVRCFSRPGYVHPLRAGLSGRLGSCGRRPKLFVRTSGWAPRISRPRNGRRDTITFDYPIPPPTPRFVEPFRAVLRSRCISGVSSRAVTEAGLNGAGGRGDLEGLCATNANQGRGRKTGQWCKANTWK